MPIRPKGAGYEVRVQYAGRRYGRSFRSREQARRWEAQLRERLSDRELGRTPKITLDEAIGRWLTQDASSLKSRDSLIRKVRVILPYIGQMHLHEIPAAAEVVKARGLQAGRKPATINRHLAILRRVANLAYKSWGWLENPLGMKIQMLAGEKQRHVYLSRPEIGRLLKVADEPTKAAIRLALLSGLRRGEQLSLTPEMVRDGAIHLADTKGGKPRTIPLPPGVNMARYPYWLTNSILRDGWEAARKAAGLPTVHWHDLRHTYASLLAQSGASMALLRDLLGHSTLAMTSRYAHLARPDLAAAVAGLKLAGKSRGNKKAA
jgi:integrase